MKHSLGSPLSAKQLVLTRQPAAQNENGSQPLTPAELLPQHGA